METKMYWMNSEGKMAESVKAPAKKPLLADEIFADTLSSAPEELKGRISIRESSTGDEIEENFVQAYDIDGKPSGISRIEFFDAKPGENPTRFIIDGSDVDAAMAEQDKWENLALEYHKVHPEVILAISDESGIGFFTFKDAYNFLEWAKEQSAKYSITASEDALQSIIDAAKAEEAREAKETQEARDTMRAKFAGNFRPTQSIRRTL